MENEKTPRPEMSNELTLAHQNGVVEFNPQQDIIRAKQASTALMQVIEATKPLKMNGKTYLYFEHWQTIAKFFNASVGIDWTKKIENGYEAKSIVYQHGQIIGGAEASCLRDEANWKTKPDFQLRSMAQTRAMAKGLRSIFGYIAVLAGVEATPAEEMNHEAPQTPKIDIRQASHVPVDISTVEDWECPVHGKTIKLIPAGVTKQGKAYAAFHSCTTKLEGKFCREKPEQVIQMEAKEIQFDKPAQPYNPPEYD